MNNSTKNNLLLAIEFYTNSNESLSKVSKKFNVSPTTLKNHLLKNGIEIRNSFVRNLALLDQVLVELTDSNIKEMSEKYGVLEDVLERYIHYLKSEVKKYAISCAILEYIDTNKFQRNLKTISNKYGINHKTLARYLKEHNIEITSIHNGLFVNEHAFDVIDTEEKAYWLGFLYADGYVTAKGHTVGLSLAIKDINHLKKFNNFLQYEGGLCICESHLFGSKSNLNTKGELMYTVSTQISNEILWNNLNEKGCIPNKSLKLKFPDESLFNYDKFLILSFIRGYFDGDGTLGMYRHSRTNPNMEESLMFVGTKPFLLKVLEYLGQGFLMHKTNCSDLTYRLLYSTRKANNAARLMYENATIYLDRKYNIYINEYAASKSGKNGEGCDANTVLS